MDERVPEKAEVDMEMGWEASTATEDMWMISAVVQLAITMEDTTGTAIPEGSVVQATMVTALEAIGEQQR